jgi:hypothetical protein
MVQELAPMACSSRNGHSTATSPEDSMKMLQQPSATKPSTHAAHAMTAASYKGGTSDTQETSPPVAPLVLMKDGAPRTALVFRKVSICGISRQNTSTQPRSEQLKCINLTIRAPCHLRCAHLVELKNFGRQQRPRRELDYVGALAHKPKRMQATGTGCLDPGPQGIPHSRCWSAGPLLTRRSSVTSKPSTRSPPPSCRTASSYEANE